MSFTNYKMKLHEMTNLYQLKVDFKISAPKTINSHALYYSFSLSLPSDTVTITTQFVKKADTLNGKGYRADLGYPFLSWFT